MSRVLLVEDSEPLGRLLLLALDRAGHTATWVTTGEAALAQVTGEPPDVVVMDQHLTDMQGADLVVQLRSVVPACRIVGVSGAPPSADLAAQFDAFMLKPVALDALLAAISPA